MCNCVQGFYIMHFHLSCVLAPALISGGKEPGLEIMPAPWEDFLVQLWGCHVIKTLNIPYGLLGARVSRQLSARDKSKHSGQSFRQRDTGLLANTNIAPPLFSAHWTLGTPRFTPSSLLPGVLCSRFLAYNTKRGNLLILGPNLSKLDSRHIHFRELSLIKW